MIKLYIDFDGVILDTIDITYKMYELEKDNYIDMKDFYKNLDWNYILKISNPINDSINNIKKILDSNLYDVYVLSHVVTKGEALGKRNFLNVYLPGLKLISVDRDVAKCDVVDPTNAILVDDYMGNLDLWYSKGGIPVKFSDKGNKYDYVSISSLDELIYKYDDFLNMIN